LTAFPDDSLADALRQMGARDVARLPVVARDDPGRLVGVLYRTDVARVYTLALARRTALRQRASEVQLDALSGVATEAVVIAPGAAAAGRTIAEVPWPREAVVASVRRGERLLLPRGDTRLEPGDELSAVVDGEAARLAVRRLCREPLSPDPER
ncbi:MAG: TrkA C-terminal domain-containing protein, partial [Acidobacteriota bacterium]|nr:TrkA C-terminal domain-containing protein [Acidobacteriota bacterium]